MSAKPQVGDVWQVAGELLALYRTALSQRAFAGVWLTGPRRGHAVALGESLLTDGQVSRRVEVTDHVDAEVPRLREELLRCVGERNRLLAELERARDLGRLPGWTRQGRIDPGRVGP